MQEALNEDSTVYILIHMYVHITNMKSQMYKQAGRMLKMKKKMHNV